VADTRSRCSSPIHRNDVRLLRQSSRFEFTRKLTHNVEPASLRGLRERNAECSLYVVNGRCDGLCELTFFPVISGFKLLCWRRRRDIFLRILAFGAFCTRFESYATRHCNIHAISREPERGETLRG
jgi:hypothetical protein